MRITQLAFYLPVLFFAISTPAQSQWRFPDCSDLEILNIKFSQPQRDTLIVTVFNECDTCYQHVYTGLIAFGENDTLAIDQNLAARPSPPNNDSLDYFLRKEKNFDLEEIVRIQMYGDLCDSLLFTPTVGVLETNGKILANKIHLYQNYPNPFRSMATSRGSGNPETKIEFELQIESKVKLNIYNLQGQRIRTLVNDDLHPGLYTTTWNGTNQYHENVASGIYIYQLIAGDYSVTRKLVLYQ